MRRFSWLTALCLIVCLLSILVGGVPSAQASPFEGGDGSPGNPYQIATAEQLYSVREAAYLDKDFVLVNDIDLSGYRSGAGWQPIGTLGSPFTGSVHGAVYTISGLYIDREDENYVGLFGSLNGAAIQNLVLRDIDVTGKRYVGSLTGYAQNSDISDSHSEGAVEAFKFAGGLAGVASGTDIRNSSAKVSVVGYNNIGGLLGQAVGGSCNIAGSYAAGDVMADSMYIGGLIGIVDSNDTQIVNSYATGNVHSDDNGHVGGLIGSFNGSKIINSYAVGTVESRETPAGGLVGYHYSGEITGSFYDTNTTGQSDTGKGEPKATVEMTQADTFTGAGWDFEDAWLIEEGVSYPYLKDNQQDPKPAPPELFAGGDGTAEAAFLINTPEHLDNIRIYLGSKHADKHFKLTGNIDMNIAPWNTDEGWESIGTSEIPFAGNFDGNGHTISNLFINRGDTACIGLFGCTDGAVLANIDLQLESVTGNMYVGGLVGRADNSDIINSSATGEVKGTHSLDEVGGLVGRGVGSTISKCKAAGTILGHNRVGGLLGYVGSSTKIIDCGATCSVTGNDYVGGLAGINYGGISDSFATGSVNGHDYIGGLTGYNYMGEILDSYAAGPVEGNDKVGGLCGYNFHGTVTSSYATGIVNGNNNTGGLVGQNSSGTVTASFYDRETSLQNDTGRGEPKTTSEMKNFSTFTGWDFSEVWVMQKSVTYPLLRWQDEAAGITIDVTGVVLDHNVLNLTVGEVTAALTAVVSPAYATNRDVNWSSSNPGVATVDANGIVTPVAEGTAIITVTTVDGGFAAECTVTVKPKETPVIDYVTVTGTNPVNGNTGVSRNPTITVNFSDNIEAGTNYHGVTLQSPGGIINIITSINSDVLTITPDSNLAYKTTYTVTIPAAAVKSSGTDADLGSTYEFSFTTRSAPSGGSGSSRVAANEVSKQIRAASGGDIGLKDIVVHVPAGSITTDAHFTIQELG